MSAQAIRLRQKGAGLCAMLELWFGPIENKAFKAHTQTRKQANSFF
jgi:phosphoribosylaminoimidazole-succinocarboxamide synthase